MSKYIVGVGMPYSYAIYGKYDKELLLSFCLQHGFKDAILCDQERCLGFYSSRKLKKIFNDAINNIQYQFEFS